MPWLLLHSKIPTELEEVFVSAGALRPIEVGDPASYFDALESLIQSHLFATYLQAATAARALNKRMAQYGLHVSAERATADETAHGWRVAVMHH
jgi:hypothetical protein